jgi:hypothetical protein
LSKFVTISASEAFLEPFRSRRCVLEPGKSWTSEKKETEEEEEGREGRRRQEEGESKKAGRKACFGSDERDGSNRDSMV